MATLPDIDTSNVSFIGYWNAIEGGGVDPANWEPSDVTSASQVRSVESYDNGVQGDADLGNGRIGRYRAKTDGWIIAWIDRTETVNGPKADELGKGPWHIANFGSMNPPTVANLVKSLFAETAASGNTGVSSPTNDDVGVYDYMHPNATGVSSLQKNVFSAGNDSATLAYSGTKHYHAVVASVKQPYSSYYTEAYVGGEVAPKTTIALMENQEGSRHHGVRLASNIDFMTESGVEYHQTHQINSSNSSCSNNIGHIMVWS